MRAWLVLCISACLAGACYAEERMGAAYVALKDPQQGFFVSGKTKAAFTCGPTDAVEEVKNGDYTSAAGESLHVEDGGITNLDKAPLLREQLKASQRDAICG